MALHEMKLNYKPFYQIQSGEKDIELRLNDEKRQKVHSDDTIVFTNIETQEKLRMQCVKVHKAKSFIKLFESIQDNKRMGFPESFTYRQMCDAMRKYYTEEEEKQYGVVGIEICRSY